MTAAPGNPLYDARPSRLPGQHAVHSQDPGVGRRDDAGKQTGSEGVLFYMAKRIQAQKYYQDVLARNRAAQEEHERSRRQSIFRIWMFVFANASLLISGYVLIERAS